MDEDKRHRLLHPIYDAIDSRNYKLGIKLCSSKKLLDIPLAQILKAHCLERTGNPTQALEICRKVQAMKPTDETLLNTMLLVFKLSGSPQEITKSYEMASSNNPSNEELMVSLFFCYVRNYDFVMQQQTAMKLYKTFHEPKYMYWAGASILLQNRCGQPCDSKLIVLGEKMVKKVLSTDPRRNSEAIQLLLDLLMVQKKYDDRLEVFLEYVGQPKDCNVTCPKPRALEGINTHEEDIDLGPIQEVERLQLEGRLYGSIGKWEKCAHAYQTLLQQFDNDNWAYWNGFVLAQLSLGDLQGIVKFIEMMQTQEISKKKSHRAPFLIDVELESLLIATDENRRKQQRLTDKLIRYMERFSLETCSFTDIQRYLSYYILFPVQEASNNHDQASFIIQTSDDHDHENDKTNKSWTVSLATQTFIEEKARKAFQMQQEVEYHHPIVSSEIRLSSHCRTQLIQWLLKMMEQNNLHTHSSTTSFTGSSTGSSTSCGGDSNSNSNSNSKNDHVVDDSNSNSNSKNDHESSQVVVLGENLKRYLLGIKVLRYIGYHEELGDKEIEQLINDLVEKYHATLGLNSTSSEGGQREIQLGDDLILMSCHLLLDLYKRNQKRTCLVEAVTLLEWGLHKSAYNFQMKLLQIRIYSILGSLVPAIHRFNELEVKQIQLDSLSYLIFDDCIRLGFFAEASRLADDVCRMHMMNARESPDYIVRSYRLGTLSKAMEVTEFNLNRMNKSHQLMICKAEKIGFALLEHCKSVSEIYEELQHLLLLNEKEDGQGKGEKQEGEVAQLQKEISQRGGLSSNQHRTVAVSWDCPNLVVVAEETRPVLVNYLSGNSGGIIQTDRSVDMNYSLNWIQLRSLVPQLLYCCGNLKDEFQQKLADFKLLLEPQHLNLLEGETLSVEGWKLCVLACEFYSSIAVATTDSTQWKQAGSLGLSFNSQMDQYFKRLEQEFHLVNQENIANLMEILSLFYLQSGNWTMILVGFMCKLIRRPKKGNLALDEFNKFYKSMKDCLSSISLGLNRLNEQLLHLIQVFKNKNSNNTTTTNTTNSNDYIVHLLAKEELQSSVQYIQQEINHSFITSLERFVNLTGDKRSFLQSIKL